ncbi:SHOCT domain-containing protein [Sphingomonas crocodyli]|uniref:SHOCT domain-containing protein n=1 Tax=Sphingomonas crocodyli TaxID=1979270 RepID=A0A437M6V2_9SPHN|nr:SHOCT domain-containing protein [Sphingomonas crocodyli]RVT93441.1 SHOCT domain-containing protein [Sphingomonas crocodyli]
MADVTHELERLVQLRTAGMITEAEFEQEKRRLLDATAVEPHAHSPQPMLVRIFALLGLIAVGILMFAAIGWLQGTKEADESAEANTSAAQAQQFSGEVTNAMDQVVAEAEPMGDDLSGAEGSEWSISTKRDPMTDLSVTTAVTRVAAAPFMVEVSAICTGDLTLEYRFAAFDEFGQPAPMRIFSLGGDPTSHFTFRVDGGASEERLSPNPRYNNVAQLDSDARYTSFTDAERAAQGSKLAVALPLVAGDAVVTLDQNNPALRRPPPPHFIANLYARKSKEKIAEIASLGCR